MCKNIAQRENKRNRKQKTKQNKINAFSLNQLLASRRLLMIEMLVETSWNIESAEKKFKQKRERKICGKLVFFFWYHFLLLKSAVGQSSCVYVSVRSLPRRSEIPRLECHLHNNHNVSAESDSSCLQEEERKLPMAGALAWKEPDQ